MASSKKPRKAYRPKKVISPSFLTRLTIADERGAAILNDNRSRLMRMRIGKKNEFDMSSLGMHLASCWQLAAKAEQTAEIRALVERAYAALTADLSVPGTLSSSAYDIVLDAVEVSAQLLHHITLGEHTETAKFLMQIGNVPLLDGYLEAVEKALGNELEEDERMAEALAIASAIKASA